MKARKLNNDAAARVIEVSEILASLPPDHRDPLAGRLVVLIRSLAYFTRKSEVWWLHYTRLGYLKEEAAELKARLIARSIH